VSSCLGGGILEKLVWHLKNLFFFVPLCVTLWLKLGGGFWAKQKLEIFLYFVYIDGIKLFS